MTRKIFLLLSLLVLLVFSPYTIFPYVLFERNNDLYSQFYPLAMMFYEPIKQFHILPFWQHGMMGGSPIVGDPIQMGYFYPLSFFVLLLPFSWFSLFFYTVHVCLAGMFSYMYCRRVWKLQPHSSIMSAIIYMFSLQMFARIEAGHITLVAAIAWVPMFFLSFSQVFDRRNFYWAGVFAFTCSMLFLLHFPYLIFCIFAICLYGLVRFIRARDKKNLFFLLMGSLVLSATLVLPHMLAFFQLTPLTTRSILSVESTMQSVPWRIFLSEVFFPFYYGINSFHEEAAFFVGFSPLILSIIGFFRLSYTHKIAVISLIMGVSFYVLESKTPVYPFLSTHFPLISMIRVPSKSWFLINGIIALLAGLGFERLTAFSSKRVAYCVLLVVFAELIIVGYIRLNKLSVSVYDTSRVPLYTYINKDEGFYRVYCPTLCLSQVEIIRSGKGLVGGYNGVQLTDFAVFAHKAGGYAFGSYSSFIPPYQTFVDTPQPNAIDLGILSTRYVVSSYLLSDGSLELEKTIDDYYIYRNSKEKPYAYWTNGPIEKPLNAQFNSREVIIELQEAGGRVIVSEPYYPAWKAHLGTRELPVQRDHGIIMSVAIPKETGVEKNKLILSYEPLGYPYAFIISSIGYIFVFVLFVFYRKKIYE